MIKIIRQFNISEQYRQNVMIGIVLYLKVIHNDIKFSYLLSQVTLPRMTPKKRFLQVIGTSIYKYISKLRMQKFSERLLKTDKRISEIAYESGLNFTNNFARQFKQIHGCTPGEYRKKHLPGK